MSDIGKGLSVKVLGAGCPNCDRVEALVREALRECGLAASIDHVRDYKSIAAYGVMSTPGLVIEDKVRSAGRIPAKAEIAAWLSEAGARKA